MNIMDFIRPNIRKLKPYSSARSLYTSGILMDANENPYNVFGDGLDLNRYPDGSNIAIRKKIAERFGMSADNCAVGNGSDEVIDILFRIFCEPGQDEVIITTPTYGMYEVSANINNVRVVDVPLVNNQLNLPGIFNALTPFTKMIFICSPNNPTGDTIKHEDILKLVQESNRIVVIDEAYGDFMSDPSFIKDVTKYKNLLVTRTLSKAFAMAGARLGYVFADKEIIDTFQKVKPPYNVNVLTTNAVLKALERQDEADQYLQTLKDFRDQMIEDLKQIKGVQEVFSTQSNFILFRIENADEIFKQLVDKGIIIRSRTKENGLANCLRVSIGTREQNEFFIQSLKEIVASK